uniref:Uncharacterized protein n=1 Tax=Anguilla anguilla TaxID=7936 RepID=A0A0E9R422_ANGAN
MNRWISLNCRFAPETSLSGLSVSWSPSMNQYVFFLLFFFCFFGSRSLVSLVFVFKQGAQ